MIVSATPHNLVAKFIIDIQGRFYYTPYPKKEILIKKMQRFHVCSVSDSV